MSEVLGDLTLVWIAWVLLEVLLHGLVRRRLWTAVCLLLPLDVYTGNVGTLLVLSELTEDHEVALGATCAANVGMVALHDRLYGLRLTVDVVLLVFAGLVMFVAPLWWEPHWELHRRLHATDPAPYYRVLRVGNVVFVAGLMLLLYGRRDEVARRLGEGQPRS
jgi:hypothetical protein